MRCGGGGGDHGDNPGVVGRSRWLAHQKKMLYHTTSNLEFAYAEIGALMIMRPSPSCGAPDAELDP